MTAAVRLARKAGRKASLEEGTFLELLRTSDQLTRGLAWVLKAEDLSMTQYNVLRILRGSPEGLPCGEIGSRMITRDPDITRLLDRMEKRGLISRWRETRDRRIVLARISEGGLELLSHLDQPVQQTHRRQMSHLGRGGLRALSDLLHKARKDGWFLRVESLLQRMSSKEVFGNWFKNVQSSLLREDITIMLECAIL
jgi:DNA-binding MarR family transcriptional regulator